MKDVRREMVGNVRKLKTLKSEIKTIINDGMTPMDEKKKWGIAYRIACLTLRELLQKIDERSQI